nr:hypothetical protein [Tanacetum cinerariifolium]
MGIDDGLWFGEIVHGDVLTRGFRFLVMLVEMYVSGGKMGDAMRVFDEMSVAVVTRNTVEEARTYLLLMVSKHHVEPKHEHYVCIVDLLRHGGLVKVAFNLVKSVSMKPNAALWG